MGRYSTASGRGKAASAASLRPLGKIEIVRRKVDVPLMKPDKLNIASSRERHRAPRDEGGSNHVVEVESAPRASEQNSGVRAGAAFMARDGGKVEWAISEGLTPYEEAVIEMEARVAAIADGRAAERVWLVEHPPLYTAGTSARVQDLVEPGLLPVFKSGRGGRLTYHGPGQRVAYVMLDLKRRGPDVRRFVASLEEWIIRTLSRFNVRGERREDRIGVWVRRPEKAVGAEDKIAAIGIRVRQWVTLHGIAINVEPDLMHFGGIVPCGVSEQRYGVTSLADLGLTVLMPDVDMALRAAFEEMFSATR
jgi:lipoyl(octanoyl) transferase